MTALFGAISVRMYLAIALVLCGAGLRIAEVLALEVTDIDGARGVIRVRYGKGDRAREAKLSSNLYQWSRRYWADERPPRPYLFASRHTGRPPRASCRNRHCPKCQALAAEEWIERRRERLLDIGHFHVVFALPSELRPLAKHAPALVYGALSRAVTSTLLELGEARFDAMLGATLVLPTWTRDLRFHPHVYAIVTAGGLVRDGQRFHHSPRYLFPVEVMGLLLRGKVLGALSRAYAEGTFASFPAFEDPAAR